MPLKQVFLALGSNVGDRAHNLARAIDALEAEGIHIVARSSLYETEPRDFTDQPWFLNMVIRAETKLFPRQLLAITQQIERKLGRVRTGVPPGGPRLIDIDILLFARIRISTEQLTIPHPRMRERRFVLEPLFEIAPELRDPATNELFAKSLRAVSGQRMSCVGPLCPPENEMQ